MASATGGVDEAPCRLELQEPLSAEERAAVTAHLVAVTARSDWLSTIFRPGSAAQKGNGHGSSPYERAKLKAFSKSVWSDHAQDKDEVEDDWFNSEDHDGGNVRLRIAFAAGQGMRSIKSKLTRAGTVMDLLGDNDSSTSVTGLGRSETRGSSTTAQSKRSQRRRKERKRKDREKHTTVEIVGGDTIEEEDEPRSPRTDDESSASSGDSGNESDVSSNGSASTKSSRRRFSTIFARTSAHRHRKNKPSKASSLGLFFLNDDSGSGTDGVATAPAVAPVDSTSASLSRITSLEKSFFASPTGITGPPRPWESYNFPPSASHSPSTPPSNELLPPALPDVHLSPRTAQRQSPASPRRSPGLEPVQLLRSGPSSPLQLPKGRSGFISPPQSGFVSPPSRPGGGDGDRPFTAEPGEIPSAPLSRMQTLDFLQGLSAFPPSQTQGGSDTPRSMALSASGGSMKRPSAMRRDSGTSEAIMKKFTIRRATAEFSNRFGPKRNRIGSVVSLGSLAKGKDKQKQRTVDEDPAMMLARKLVEAGAVQVEEEKCEWDVLYEHQRGLVVFGALKFSANILAQFDPAPWTDGKLKDTPFTPHDYPLPTPLWHWIHPEWLVDMGGDVDERGWSYAVRFRSSYWRGEADPWRSFVRRRRWIRGRSYSPKSLFTAKALDAYTNAMGLTTGRIKVDWEAIDIDQFAKEAICHPKTESEDEVFRDARTVQYSDPEDTEPEQEATDVVGMGFKMAVALLPVSTDKKDDIFTWDGEIDVRNPFLAWSFVKREGARWLATPSGIGADEPPTAVMVLRSNGKRSDEDLMGIWRDAVVHINYRRIARVMRSTRTDAEKLRLWNWYIRAEEDAALLQQQQLATSQGSTKGRPALRKLGLSIAADLSPGDASGRPEASDVWDLIESHLGEVLGFFEFESARVELLRLIYSHHNTAEAAHRFKPSSKLGSLLPQSLDPGKLPPDEHGAALFYADYEALLNELRRKGKGAQDQASV